MIILKYWNEKLQIGLADWKQVYKFPEQDLMNKEIHQDSLYYRQPGTALRISYKKLKKGLQKKKIIIYEELNLLPF